MSAGFKKGAASANRAGRPTKIDSNMRQLTSPLEALGCSNLEIEALAIAYAAESEVAIDAVVRVIIGKLRQDLDEADAEQRKQDLMDIPAEEGDGDIF